MRCGQCQHENNETAKFCEECGAKLIPACPGCGYEVSPRAKFCPECGMPLSAQPPAAQTQDSRLQTRDIARPGSSDPAPVLGRYGTPEAERRQLTVMFCDLVGSTPLAEKLDPEELREVILAYQQVGAAAIRRFDGYLARYIGDGLLVYFGYPQAHEDDAQRAVRTGLGIVAALPELNARLQQTVGALREVSLQVRIGIHTGLVVVSDMGGGGYRDPMAIVGETPNIAARLQGIAEPNTVVISAATCRLVQGLFECQERGPQALKGVSTPVPVYCVLGESEAQSRFEAAVGKGLTPLVGREEELGLLQRRWEQAKAGEGQVVLLTGEPGIGKSRLVQTLKEQVSTEGATRIEFRCSPYYQNSAFYPLIEHLQRLLQFALHDPPQAKVAKLTQRLASYRFPQADTLPLLAALFSLPHPAGYPPLAMSPQKQKQKTYEALISWVLEDAEKAVMCCVWEDLHWADPSTLEFLSLFIEQVSAARILMLLTARPEFVAPWGTRSFLNRITLGRLGRSQVEEMVERLTGGKTLPAEVARQVVQKTDGIPLFVEELIKMVLESGLVREANGSYELMGSLPHVAIPATLHDSLMARLDRLAPVREVAQLGATLGREFSYEVLQAVSSLDEEILQQGLAQLVEAELLYQRGLPPQAQYIFKHALVQDTAYQSLLKSKRQQYHTKIAQVLEERFPEMGASHPELLAHHYTQASLWQEAIPYWQRAGQNAIQCSANVEAIRHLTKGLELLVALPSTPERIQQELDLQTFLGPALMAVNGYAAPEVEKAYARARELCQQLGEAPQTFTVLRGLWGFYIVRADVQTAHELGEQCLTLAQRAGGPALFLWTHYALGMTLFHLGEFASAREHLEKGMTLYNPEKRRSPRALQDPGVAYRSYAALALWFLGYPDQALKRSHEALTLARELSHPFSLAYALNLSGMVHQFRREAQETQRRVEAAIALCSEQGIPYWLAYGTILQGWASAAQGQGKEGIAQVRQGLAVYGATGAEIARPLFLTLLAEAYGEKGQAEEGLRVLAEALAVVDKTGDRFHKAELYRLKGVLTLQQFIQPLTPNPEAEAEECFLKAIEIAQQQRAKSLELRAVMSLARLWQQQGKKGEAWQMLAEIYGWFTEGFDTKDLREASALLEELSH